MVIMKHKPSSLLLYAYEYVCPLLIRQAFAALPDTWEDVLRHSCSFVTVHHTHVCLNVHTKSE